MPIVKLSDGREARIGVYHVDNVRLPDHPGQSFRGTCVWFTFPEGYAINCRSICKPPDQFCRRKGRIMAARHLMQSLGKVFSKQDKALIFKTICPECRNAVVRKSNRVGP